MSEKSLKQELQEKIAKIERDKKQSPSKQSVTMKELQKRYENEPRPVEKKISANNKPVSNKRKNHLGFTKATVLIPDKLQAQLKKKAKDEE